MGLFLLLSVSAWSDQAARGGRAALDRAVAGIVFMLAGISIAVGAIHGVSETGELPKDSGWWMRLFYYLIGVVIAGALACIGSGSRSAWARVLRRHRHVPAVAGSKRDGWA